MLVAIVLMLELGPTESKPAIVVERVELSGRATEADHVMRRDVRDVVSRYGRAVAVPPDCDTSCAEMKADETAARFRLRVALRELNRDYVIALELADTTGSVIASEESSCEICTEPEAMERLAQELQRLLAANVRTRASLEVTSRPSGARVLLDGNVIGLTPIRIDVEPGTHRAALELQGQQRAERTLEADNGQHIDLHVDLAPIPVAQEEPPSRRKAWVAGWASFAAGLALAGGGVPLLVLDGRPVRSDCDGDQMDDYGNCRYRWDTAAAGATLTALGGAAIGAGIGLVVWSRAKKIGKPVPRRARFEGASLRF